MCLPSSSVLPLGSLNIFIASVFNSAYGRLLVSLLFTTFSGALIRSFICDADLGPQDLLLWLQYSNTQTHRLQRSCRGKGIAGPLSQEESASECLSHSLKGGVPWPLPWQAFIGFPGPLHQRRSSFTMQRFFMGGYLCRHRRGCRWIHQRRIFAM